MVSIVNVDTCSVAHGALQGFNMYLSASGSPILSKKTGQEKPEETSADDDGSGAESDGSRRHPGGNSVRATRACLPPVEWPSGGNRQNSPGTSERDSQVAGSNNPYKG